MIAIKKATKPKIFEASSGISTTTDSQYTSIIPYTPNNINNFKSFVLNAAVNLPLRQAFAIITRCLLQILKRGYAKYVGHVTLSSER